VGWIKLLWQILRNRGLESYGKEHIYKMIEKLEYSQCASKYEQRRAENFVNRLSKYFSKTRIQGVNLKRIGPKYDGGYEVPTEVHVDFIISGGIGKTSEFEYDLAASGKKVFAIDPTVSHLPHPHKNITLIRKWFSNNDSNNSISLEGVLKLCSKNSKVLLKLDIEGDEYIVLESLKLFKNQIVVLVVEFHENYKLSNIEFLEQYIKIFKTLESSYIPVAFKANNWANFINFGKSFIPEVYEATFVNKFAHRKTNNKFKSKKTLNYSNNPNRIEIPNKIFCIQDD